MFIILQYQYQYQRRKEIKIEYNHQYPSVTDLRKKAKRTIPRFAFEYLDGGCNEEINLANNTADIHSVELKPNYLGKYTTSTIQTKLFGQSYSAPFGIAPIGLQGLVWPKSSEILAKAAVDHNIPFILSTVSTASIEKIGKITEGKAWFQLYYPSEDSIRKDILKRVQDCQYPVLVLICDTPTFGLRYKDIKNGLSMPPRMSIANYLQIVQKPKWALHTFIHGQPKFATLSPYMPKKLDLNQLGLFMNSMFSGRLNRERIAPIRDLWKGKLVLKGLVSDDDVETAIQLGCDGVIVSNHGGRQLDSGLSSIKALPAIVKKHQKKIVVMMDSGIRSGPDIACSLASGAKFTFIGRAGMYSVAALGESGGNHIISLMKAQLQQIMEQLGCERVQDLPKHIVLADL